MRSIFKLLLVSIVVTACATPARAQRVFGLDTSSATNRPSPPTLTQWQNSFNDADGDGVAYKFAFVRSSRGGTSDATRLDDTEFYFNITRATQVGMLAGSYHYTRPDVATHTAVDDANHYLERAGMYMKPGYLLPVFDLEAGNTQHSLSSLTAWSMDFINTIHAAKGINPIVYTNSSYNNDEVGAQVAFNNFGTTPKTDPRTFQWVARPSGNLQTGQPGAATNYPNPYGAWDPNFVTRTNSRDPAINPWVFWQNGAGSPNGFLIDYNAANGNIEFVKDFLVPALWMNSDSGEWGTIANWNSDNPDYVAGDITKGPAPRLPNNQSLDWVRLENSGGGTVTISSGNQTVRKLYTQQALNINGGSLSIGYVPGSGGKWDVPAEFNAAVSLASGASYSAHTTQIDGGGGQFNVNGGTVTFKEMQLASHASNSGKIIIGGDVTFGQTGGNVTSVIRSTGSLAQAGSVSLTAGDQTFNVNDGSAGVDLNIRLGVGGAGRLVKSGAGTMQLSNANTYTGGTTVTNGVLQAAGNGQLGTVPGSLQTDNIVLNGGTLRTGAQIESATLTNAGSGYTSFPSLSIGGAGANVHSASANVLAGITSIAVTSGGSGYVNQAPSSPPAANTAGTFVDIVGGGGTGATAYATVVGGVVTGITISNPGTGYTSMPTIHISATAISGVAGSGANGSVTGIALQGIALNDGGFDYTTPIINLTGGGGSGATASATSSSTLNLDANRGVSLTAAGGTLFQTAGTTLNIAGPISSTGSGTLTKSGAGTLVLSGANTYSGPTNIASGVLSLSGAAATLGNGTVTVQGAGAALDIQSGVADAIDDAATVSLFGGGVAGVADQGFANLGAGITEVAGALILNGVAQPTGTYGATGSGATNIFDEFFSGTGILQIGTIAPILEGDYNDDGVVDAADYVVWLKNVGQPAGTLANDSTGLPIGDQQFDLWQANFGNSESGSGGAVPEPTAATLLFLAILGSALARRQRYMLPVIVAFSTGASLLSAQSGEDTAHRAAASFAVSA